MNRHQFISYSSVESTKFALKLCDALSAGPPPILAWLDRRKLIPGMDWDEQIAEAIRTCDSLIFVMTRDSVSPLSICKREYTRALKYKKPIIPIKLHADAEMPFLLEPRQYIDFTTNFEVALAHLRNALQHLSSPEGILQQLECRLTDALRDLHREDNESQQTRISDDIIQLEKQIEEQKRIISDPEATSKRIQKSIATGLGYERRPSKLTSNTTQGRFINSPASIAPIYFQDRYIETKLIAGFLRDESLRLMTIIGRGGVGKTSLVCRVLKSLENGQLPDDLGDMEVDGIIYLSAHGSRRTNTPNIYVDLCKLLPKKIVQPLNTLFKKPRISTKAKIKALLEAFPSGRTILLLDNIEDIIDSKSHNIRDKELNDALRVLLEAPHHGVKVIVTTRIAPRELMLIQPGRQRKLDLDEGLEPNYAKNILRELDVERKLGLKSASDTVLDEACKRTRGNPRALEALFAILSVDRNTSLEDILRDNVNTLPNSVVKELVGEAFSRLDSTSQLVMQALAIYSRPVTLTAITYLLQPYLRLTNIEAILAQLVNTHFVRKDAALYYLHPVDRAYALNSIPVGDISDRDETKTIRFTQFALLHRAANYFQQTRLARRRWKSIEDLSPQLAEFDLRYAGQDYDRAGWLLVTIDTEYLYKWGFYNLAIGLHRLLQGKPKTALLNQICTSNLGNAYTNTGQLSKAINCSEKALIINKGAKVVVEHKTLLERVGKWYADQDIMECVITYNQVLRVVSEAWNYNLPAVKPGKQAVLFARKSLISLSEGNQGESLGNLARTYNFLGKHERAFEYCKRALQISRRYKDKYSESMHLRYLGHIYRTLVCHDLAIKTYQQARKTAAEVGDRIGENRATGSLGRSLGEVGQYGKAIKYLTQATVIAQKIKDRLGEVYHLSHLGLAYRDIAEYKKAKEYYDQAITIANDIGETSIKLYCIGGIGKIYLALEEYDAAVSQFSSALDLATQIRMPPAKQIWGAALAQSLLHMNCESKALRVINTAVDQDVLWNNHRTIMLQGLILACLQEHENARIAFNKSILSADGLLAKSANYYSAKYTRALSLSALGLLTPRRKQHLFLTQARQAYQEAIINCNTNTIVEDALRLLKKLAQIDERNLLSTVFAILTTKG